MIELVIKTTILVVAVVIVVAIWRSRTDELMRLREAKNYAMGGMACVALAKLIDVSSLIALEAGALDAAGRYEAELVGSTVIALGIVICTFAVLRWLDAGKKLSWIADYEVERSDELQARLVERGLALSTVPAMLYRSRWSRHDPRAAKQEFLNDKVEQILGYSRRELEHDRDFALSLMHPEDRKRFAAEGAERASHTDWAVLEHRFRHRDGSYRWIRRHERQLTDAKADVQEVVGCAFDVTDLKDAESRLQNFLDFAPDAVVTVDETQTIVMANEQASRAFAENHEDLVGRSVCALFSPEFQDDMAKLVEGEFQGGREWRRGLEQEVICQQTSGETFPAEINLSAIDTGDERLVAMGVHDISHRKETEAALQQAQKMEAVGQLTGGIAHDFNNMLTVISGNLEMLDLTGLDDESCTNIVVAKNATARAAELTNRLLAFSRQQELEPEITSVNELVVGVTDMLQRTLAENVTLQTNLADDLWQSRIDTSQLENALVNLCINARDAMLSSGGVLQVSTANISEAEAANIPDVPAADFVRLTIADNGDGIEADNLPRIFEPFFTTKGKGKGSGLGLSMVYGFVRQSGGQLLVSSTPGQGTTVSIYLPRCSCEMAEDYGTQPRNQAVPTGSERILVVEDNPSVRRVASNLLKSLNYDVIEANDGPDALELLRRGETFDLLFTDLVMPGGLTGVELAESMRSDRPGLRVLFTSGYSGAEEGLQAPANESVLHKPYMKDALARRVREALDQ